VNAHLANLGPKTPTRRMNIGLKMANWHSSMGDPIYAVGSYYVANVEYPHRRVVEAARERLVLDIGKKLYVSTDDQRELREIVAYLDEVLGNKSDLPEVATCLDPDLELFIRGYVVAALWSTNDESTPDGGVPMDDNYGPDDIAGEAMARMREDCAKFWTENKALFTDENLQASPGCSIAEYAGHDFWLTRNGHGCGYWDGDWVKPVGVKLTEAAKKMCGCDLYVGDDKKIYIC